MAFYCDFHSHSRKHNVFIYGCEDKDLNELPLIEQVFPLMMHKASNGKVGILPRFFVSKFVIDLPFYFSSILRIANLWSSVLKKELEEWS